ncbi:MAG TPA: hypothetical protein VE091_00635 [Gemmatimonadales bacterium]|nr:hypothetical protein [Gemmatimonadales bacterium]
MIERSGRLLFPRFLGGREAMLGDFLKLLDRASVSAGFAEPVLEPDGTPKLNGKGRPKVRGTLTSKMFRHAYLQRGSRRWIAGRR